MSSQQTVTLPLHKLLRELLGDDHCRQISADIADILEQVCKNKQVIFVQREGRTGEKYKDPVIWWLWAWRQDTESWLAAKRRSDIERDQRFVFEENVKRVTKAVTRETGIEGDAARAVGYRLWKKSTTTKATNLLVNNWNVTICNNVTEI